MTQRMYMLGVQNDGSFRLMGASGSAYTVRVTDREITCTCPDFASRQSTCKHMMFMVGRVGGDEELLARLVEDRDAAVGESGPAIRACIRAGFARVRGAIPAPAAADDDGAGEEDDMRDDGRRRSKRPRREDGQGERQKETTEPRDNPACPVCFEDFGAPSSSSAPSFPFPSPAEATTHCRRQCGYVFHSACLASWLRASARQNCPMCRVAWD